MAPKYKQILILTYDTTRFVFFKASQRVQNDISKRILIAERGFDVDVTYKAPSSIRDIERKRWKKLRNQPQPASIEIVCEFYANATEHENYKTKMQGKTMTFDSNSINIFLGLFKNDDEYS